MAPRTRARASTPPPEDDESVVAEQPDDVEAEGEDEDDEPPLSDEAESEEEDEALSEEDDGEGAPPDGEAETVIRFEDDEAPDGDDDKGGNTVIRRIRDRNRELIRENAQLKELAAQHVMPEVQLGPKPTLRDLDFDEEAFEEALDEWKDRKAKIDQQTADRAIQAQAAEIEWQQDMAAYASRRAALGVPDAEFVEAAELVKSALSLDQQAVIVKAAQDGPAFVFALSRSDGRLAELAKIKDPVKLGAAVARMEGGLKVVKRRKAPAPDRPLRGSGKLPGSTDKQLEKLEAEAERTGDRTELIRYRKRLAERGKK